jgi:hypothetical protein
VQALDPIGEVAHSAGGKQERGMLRDEGAKRYSKDFRPDPNPAVRRKDCGPHNKQLRNLTNESRRTAIPE